MVDAKAKPAAAPPEPKRLIKPVINAVAVLRRLTATGEPERAIELARALKINPSTCFNILRTLVAEGVVAFDPVSKTYRPSVGMLGLVNSPLGEVKRLQMARPVMHELADRFTVTATLWRRIPRDRLELAAVEQSASELRIHMSPGQRVPYLMGATGRLIAAELGLGKSELAPAFRALRWARPISLDTYWDEVELARERGWAMDDGYFSHGIMSLAAPVRDPSGAIGFILGGVMVRGQYDEAGIERLGREMKRLGPVLTALLF